MKYKNSTKTWSFLLLLLAIILTVMPFIWIVATSFKDFISIMSSKFFFSPTLENYTNLLAGRDSEYPRFLLNSVIVSLSTTFISLVIGAMGSYSLARLPIPLKLDKILLGWLLVLRIIHPMAFALPFFMIMYKFGLYNTIYALIFVYTAINMPFTRSEEHTSELQSRPHLVCRLLLEKKKKDNCSVLILLIFTVL